MDEIISSILDAEKKAEEILKNSTETAKSIILEGEGKAEDIKSDAIATLRAQKKQIIIDAELEAEKRYQEIVLKGSKEADEIIESANSNVDKACDFIVKEILGR